jgi:hypothetical protein
MIRPTLYVEDVVDNLSIDNIKFVERVDSLEQELEDVHKHY